LGKVAAKLSMIENSVPTCAVAPWASSRLTSPFRASGFTVMMTGTRNGFVGLAIHQLSDALVEFAFALGGLSVERGAQQRECHDRSHQQVAADASKEE
jgi:hypothetical protein